MEKINSQHGEILKKSIFAIRFFSTFEIYVVMKYERLKNCIWFVQTIQNTKLEWPTGEHLGNSIKNCFILFLFSFRIMETKNQISDCCRHTWKSIWVFILKQHILRTSPSKQRIAISCVSNPISTAVEIWNCVIHQPLTHSHRLLRLFHWNETLSLLLLYYNMVRFKMFFVTNFRPPYSIRVYSI